MGLIPFALALGTWGLLKGGNRSPTIEPRPSVRVAPITRGKLQSEVRVAGELLPWFAVELQARTAGFVRRLHVDIGSRVKEGDVLAKLDVPLLPEEIERAKAGLRRAEEDAKRAEVLAHEQSVSWTRLEAAARSQPQLLSQQDLDTARAKDQSAAAAYGVAREQVQVARAELARLVAQEAATTITAPFDGVITRLTAHPGDFLQGGLSPSGQAKPLVRLAQVQRLRLTFPVSMGYVSGLHVGDGIQIRFDDGHMVTNPIARLGRELSSLTRTMDVEADINNESLELVPGTYVTVIIHPAERTNALSVPLIAVKRQSVDRVQVVTSDHRIEERIVRLGLETSDRAEVLEGLREGESVVIAGANRVRAGQEVSIQVAEPASSSSKALNERPSTPSSASH
jgi:RND family efflux transporter MFP subunit